MRTLLLFTVAVFAALAAHAKDFKVYAQFVADTRVELSDGAMWLMDKGDVFPVVAFKDMQKNVVLQLAGSTFMTETVRIRILKPEEVEAGLETYRKNVRAFLESKSGKLQEELKATPLSKPGEPILPPVKPAAVPATPKPPAVPKR